MAAGGPSDRGPVGVTDEDDTVMSDANRTDLGDFDAPTRVARAETDVDAKDDPAPAPPRAYVPQRLGPSDVVPEFRRELRLTRFDNGGVRVFDSATGQTCMLNEFEVSLARMLDGKRRVVEILASSGRLGIPVNLESLQKFVERLEEHGLLGQAQSGAPREVATWASRGQWESSVRTLFQSGIRFLRMGKHAEAVGYFEALLEEDPQKVEALELLAMAKEAMDAAAVPEPIASAMDVVDEEPEAPTVPPPTRASAPAIRPSAPAMRPPAPPMRPSAPAMRPSEPAMRPSA